MYHSHNQRLIPFTILSMIFSSLIPYTIRFVNVDYNSSVTQCFYGIIVFLVTLSNVALSHSLEKANHSEQVVKEKLSENRKRLYVDIALKGIGMVICLTIYPPAMMISVLFTMFLMIIPARRTEQ